jgi:hypothetical protein
VDGPLFTLDVEQKEKELGFGSTKPRECKRSSTKRAHPHCGYVSN